MKRLIPLLALLALASSAHSQDAKQFNFVGGVSLVIGKDSMTDAQTCAAFTQNAYGAYVGVTDSAAALIMLGKNIAVDYSAPALLRIGSSRPFALVTPYRPHDLVIPRAKMPAVVSALYAQAHIQIRFTEWPSGQIFDHEIIAGDFARAYDKAVGECHWLPQKIKAAHPAIALKVLSAPGFFDDYASGLWSLHANADGTCKLHLDGQEIASSEFDSTVLETPIRFFDVGGKLVGGITSTAARFSDFASLASQVGDSGMIDHGDFVYRSLYGYADVGKMFHDRCVAPPASEFASQFPGYMAELREPVSRELYFVFAASQRYLGTECSVSVQVAKNGRLGSVHSIAEFKNASLDRDCAKAFEMLGGALPLPAAYAGTWARVDLRFSPSDPSRN